MDFSLLKRMNWLAILPIAALAALGLLFIYSASKIVEDQPVERCYRQAMWFGISAILFACIVATDYRKISRDAWWVYGITIFLLILVLLVGKTMGGAKRWLFFLGMGFQPSEFAKIATVVLIARYLSRPDVDLDKWRAAGVTFLIAGVPIGLIILEPAVGTAFVFVPAMLAMMFIARVAKKVLLTLTIAALTYAIVAASAIFIPPKLNCNVETQTFILKCVVLKPYHAKRIRAIVNPGQDRKGADWNKDQSEIAIGSGGLYGKGFRNGRANILCYLPKTVAPTDFIFSVLAEEEGFLGGLSVILLFTLVIVTGLWTAATASDTLGRLLCVGISTLVFVHVVINVAMTMGRLPVIGLPLPLMSSGGSFLISMMAGLAIIQSVHVRRRVVR